MRFSFRSLFLIVPVGWSLAQNPGVVGPAWTASPFHPAAIPLAVRSPYLNCWAKGGNASAPISNMWPTLWDMKSILGWSIYVKVDDVAYRVLGQAPLTSGVQQANQTGFSFTATQSTFTHMAGNVMVTTSFLSPIEPGNLVLQSLPASYLSVTTQSTDGSRHATQVYSDISAEWISGDNGLIAAWGTNISSSSIIHNVSLQTPQPFAVDQNHIQDATAYYGIINGPAISWQIGPDAATRAQFTGSGKLMNIANNTFRPVSTDFSVFGLSADLGTVVSSNGPVVFALGLIRDPVVRSLSANGQTEERSLYFFTQFSNAFDAMNHFISDFGRAAAAANNFDSSVRSAASAVSSDYADLIDLSARQVFASVEITVGKDGNGNWNLSDVQAFMNNGTGGMSTVDVMYAAFPLFLQTNPVIAGALLSPLLSWQQGGGYPNAWAAHDLGLQYPDALGDPKDNAMPVEESANMLIMTLAQARVSGDATLVSNYYNILDKWAEYLVSNTMNPAQQTFTDTGLTGPVNNDTNLALKGIIGVRAMAEIASAVNNSGAATKYTSIASGLLNQWQSEAFSVDNSHLVLNFGNDTSSLSLPYNLYADKLLGLSFVPQMVYDVAAASIKSQSQTYGVALDSRSPSASKTDWSLFTAAALTDTDARNTLISSVRKYAANQLSNVPFSDYYDALEGKSIAFQARPVQGAMYSILALQVPSKPIVLPPPASTSTIPSTSSNPKNAALSGRRFSLMYLISPIAIATIAEFTARRVF